jgi:hypothetical protein
MALQATLKSDPPQHAIRQRLVAELTEHLRNAEAVLTSLHDAKRVAEQQCREFERADAIKAVTGVSAIERSIATTSRMIERIKRELAEVRDASSLSEIRCKAGLGSLTLVG